MFPYSFVTSHNGHSLANKHHCGEISKIIIIYNKDVVKMLGWRGQNGSTQNSLIFVKTFQVGDYKY